MNWKAPLIVIIAGLALVIGTVVTVANGHDGTPAVTVLVSQPGSGTSALPLSDPTGPCALDSTASPGPGGVTVSGACSGTLSGTAVCGDATGSVALALQTTAGPDSTFSLIMQFENDPIGTGPQAASLFAEVHGPGGFWRWSDRSATIPVTAKGQIILNAVTLPAEAGTDAAPLVLSGSAICAADA
jgi:hypothetical protein